MADSKALWRRPKAQEEIMTYQTSQSNPLRIAELEVRPGWGRLGVTLAPGKKQHDAMSGPVERDLNADLDVIAAWNTAAVITLLEPHELDDLQIPRLGDEVARRHMEWYHWPIVDGEPPSDEFGVAWPQRARRLIALLEGGASVLVHCKGGLGRAGTIAARLLVEAGEAPESVVGRLREVRPGAIETPQQHKWATQPVSVSNTTDLPNHATIEDRATGALVGLAVGDAVGTTLEFQPRPAFADLQDLMGGGVFGLRRGEWTDDTAMALALADSLLLDPDLNAFDLMARFSDWQQHGTYSCTATCFDIGNTVRSALEHWRGTGDPMAGSTDPQSAGNGALMRLAPVAIRHWNSPERRKDVAVRQTRTTHGAAEAVEASDYFAGVLGDLIGGSDLLSAIHQTNEQFSGSIDRIRLGSWRNRSRDSIRSDGYVVHSLEAAIWAVTRTTSFRSAVLLAANLGGDADTTAAITGQIAGSLYGLSGIPAEWVDALAWSERIKDAAQYLFSESMS